MATQNKVLTEAAVTLGLVSLAACTGPGIVGDMRSDLTEELADVCDDSLSYASSPFPKYPNILFSPIATQLLGPEETKKLESVIEFLDQFGPIDHPFRYNTMLINALTDPRIHGLHNRASMECPRPFISVHLNTNSKNLDLTLAHEMGHAAYRDPEFYEVHIHDRLVDVNSGSNIGNLPLSGRRFLVSEFYIAPIDTMRISRSESPIYSTFNEIKAASYEIIYRIVVLGENVDDIMSNENDDLAIFAFNYLFSLLQARGIEINPQDLASSLMYSDGLVKLVNNLMDHEIDPDVAWDVIAQTAVDLDYLFR